MGEILQMGQKKWMRERTRGENLADGTTEMDKERRTQMGENLEDGAWEMGPFLADGT
jgi:hypothetical protein